MLKAIAISALLFLSQFASAQANVNESLETITYWVDATAGSDNNPGTQDAPFQTIGKATAQAETNNQAGVGTLINVNPGLYREAVTLKATGTDTPLPITIQAVTPGTAIMTGADSFTGWQPYSGNASIYQTVWPYQFGLCAADSGGGPFQQDIVLRREVAFVNGKPLTQVMSLNQMMQGTFFVDEANAAVYVYPAAGTDIGAADVEIGTRGALLTITAKSNVVVRGMTFEYSNSCRNGAALPVMSSDNVLLDNDSYYWNNAQGPAMTLDTNFTVQNNIANHNGIGGMAGDATKNSQWTNNVTNYNNWRGAQGAFYDWSSAGFHPYATHDDAISGLTSAYNQCFGIHWDTDNRDITADKMILSENLLSEALIEKSEGPITITNSTMCGGNPITNPANEIGFWLRNSEQVTISNSVIAGASQELFDVTGTAGGYPVTDWETGQVYNLIEQNVTLNNNTIVGSALNQNVFYDSSLGGADWASFLSTLSSDYNTWWNPVDSTAFLLPVPVNNTQLDFPGWQAFTLQDQHSTFAAPTGSYPVACTVAPEGPDFWYVTDPIKGLIDIQAGGSATFSTTVVALGGFSGPVSLSVDGVQNIPGATYSWDTSTVNTSGNATLTVNTATTTPTGVYPITMIANNGATTRTLTGSVLVNTVLAVGPQVANMGPVAVGSTSANFPVTLADLGPNGVAISSITTTGDFSQTNTCGTQVGGSNKFNFQCSITLTFTPTAVGPRTGTLTIVAADPGSPLTVSLSGVGVGVPVLGMSPTSMSFPDTDVKSQSAPSTVILTNNGTANLNISNIAFTGQNPSYFTQTNTCNAPLPPGSSCNVQVVFAPLYVGAVSANVSVTSDASVLPQTVALTGNAVAPTLGVSTSSMSFGSEPIGLPSVPMQSTITNTGTGPLLISSITITGANAGDYAQTSTCPISPSSLAVGASCTISATFNPTALGVRFGNILITDNVVAGNTTITMTGTGTTPAAVSLSPSSLTFPGTNINTTSAPLPVTLTNSGNGALNITSITVTGTNAGNFTQTNTCGASVAAGATCTINVTFTPTATGARSGSVTITDNASPATQTISLSGTGTAPTVSFSPTSIVFGNQPQGLPSLPLPSVLTNTGTGPLIITGITITGNNPGDFTQTSTCPVSPASLAPGATCVILPV
nr:choice-of-anchor D domain-containing protein [Terriglobales bacterium]